MAFPSSSSLPQDVSLFVSVHLRPPLSPLEKADAQMTALPSLGARPQGAGWLHLHYKRVGGSGWCCVSAEMFGGIPESRSSASWGPTTPIVQLRLLARLCAMDTDLGSSSCSAPSQLHDLLASLSLSFLFLGDSNSTNFPAWL